MPAHRYTETHERYYPRLGLTARPGDVVEFDDAPPDDGRWEPAVEAKPRKTRKDEE